MIASAKSSFWRRLRRANEGCKLGFSFKLCLFEEGFSLLLFGLFIPLRFLDRWRYEPHEMMEAWGFNTCERTIQLYLGRHCTILHMPWEFEHIKYEVMRLDGSWVHYVASYERDKEPDGRWTETYPYRYVLRDGTVQNRNATVYVERREWRWRCAVWSPWPAIRRQSIEVSFDDEVGERTGSWKGGVIGCGYDMRVGETPMECLRRMERERKFD